MGSVRFPWMLGDTMEDPVWGSQGGSLCPCQVSQEGERLSCLSVSTLIRAGKGAVEGCYGQEEGRGEMGGREKQKEKSEVKRKLGREKKERRPKKKKKKKERPTLCLPGWAPATQGTDPGLVAPQTVSEILPLPSKC